MTGNNSGALIFTLFALMDDRHRQRQRSVYRVAADLRRGFNDWRAA